jgi:hypothetical protein
MSPGPDRLDTVNIRIGIAAADTTRAAAALHIPAISGRGTTVHLLAYSCGPTSLRLAAAGVSLLLEQDAEATWMTVRVRPMRRALLNPNWNGFWTDGTETLYIEQERDANSRVLIARLVAAGPSSGLPIAEAGVNLAEILWPRQRSFVEHCTGIQIGDQHVSLTRSVKTRQWAVRLGCVDAHVQRWIISPAVSNQPGFDALEVSRRSSETEADFLLPALYAGLRRRGLEPQDAVAAPEERISIYFDDSDLAD